MTCLIFHFVLQVLTLKDKKFMLSFKTTLYFLFISSHLKCLSCLINSLTSGELFSGLSLQALFSSRGLFSFFSCQSDRPAEA